MKPIEFFFFTMMVMGTATTGFVGGCLWTQNINRDIIISTDVIEIIDGCNFLNGKINNDICDTVPQKRTFCQ